MSKRTFVRQAGMAVAGAFCMNRMSVAGPRFYNGNAVTKDDLWKWSKECMFYEVTPRGTKCLVCPNECTLKTGETSTCRNRINHEGKLYSIAYGNPCALHVDPIEKKPFYHFHPGTRAFSIATAGCNFACLNCQNWEISQSSPKETQNFDLMPAKVVAQTTINGCQSIAYTYSEPITWCEYVYDTSVISRRQGIRNVLVSNGYINEKPLRVLCKVLDAATIDLKSFDETTYLRLNAGKLQPVLNALKIFKEEGVWLEISNLVVPNWSDNLDMIKRMCDWLYSNGFQDNPLHFLRFQPLYKLNQLPPTPVTVLEKAREIARNAGIKFVYLGNVAGSAASSTVCPKCKKVIVERKGYQISSFAIKNGTCSFCGEKIAGKWN